MEPPDADQPMNSLPPLRKPGSTPPQPTEPKTRAKRGKKAKHGGKTVAAQSSPGGAEVEAGGDAPPKRKKPFVPPVPKGPRRGGRGLFFQLEVVVGVAFLVATLFTAWTPGQAWPTPPPLADTSIALPPLTATPLGAPTATPRTKPLIGIVAGHWKHDSGAVCDEGLPSEVTEESINLTIASLVQKRLVEMGYDADLLAEFDPRLQGYQSTALISIHNDSCEFINPEATGFKVAAAWATRHPENAARLTACLRSRYAQVTKLPLHSTSVTADMSSYHAFEEIDETTPAVIIETGFMNLDREFLTKQPEVATDGIVAGLVCYLKNESVESSPVPGASAPSAAPTPPPTPQSNP